MIHSSGSGNTRSAPFSLRFICFRSARLSDLPLAPGLNQGWSFSIIKQLRKFMHTKDIPPPRLRGGKGGGVRKEGEEDHTLMKLRFFARLRDCSFTRSRTISSVMLVSFIVTGVLHYTMPYCCIETTDNGALLASLSIQRV